MHIGKCIKCGSDQVYKSINGIVSGDKKVFVKNISRLTPSTDRMTFLCARCGYYENCILDDNILRKVPGSKWEKV